jgi:hypothetical protein
MDQCDRPYSTYSSLQIDRTFDPFEDTTIYFAFDSNGYNIAKLTIPSNAIVNNDTSSMNSQLQTLQRIQVYPVPDSILEQVQNKISDSRVSYLSRVYSLKDNLYLGRAHTLLSPAVMLEYAQSVE